jgi:hypothetical protein|tara:strand:- start:783 stop:1307 length:525 start_codon:yes stop_codon:yes gene_type:complete
MSTLKVNTLQNTSGNTLTFIKQVKFFTRSAPITYSSSSNTIQKVILVANITPSSTSSKILVLANVDGVANKTGGGGEWEGCLARHTTAYSNDADASGWTGLRMLTGLGGWSSGNNSTGTLSADFLDSPSSTSTLYYYLLANTRSNVYINNEFNESGAGAASGSGTTITLMEVAG